MMRRKTAKENVLSRFSRCNSPEFIEFLSRHQKRFEDLYFWQPPKFNLGNGTFSQPEECMSFQKGHVLALIYLVEKKGLSFDDALTEISLLFDAQARALIKLYDHGLRRENLSAWITTHELDQNPLCDLERYNRVDFTDNHTDALFALLTDANNPLNLNDALYGFNDLNSAQAKSLGELYKFGLRRNHLLAWQRPVLWLHYKPTEERFCFTKQHADALKHFIVNEKLMPEKAIEIMNGLMAHHLQTSAVETQKEQMLVQEAERKKILRYEGRVAQQRNVELVDSLRVTLSTMSLNDVYQVAQTSINALQAIAQQNTAAAIGSPVPSMSSSRAILFSRTDEVQSAQRNSIAEAVAAMPSVQPPL